MKTLLVLALLMLSISLVSAQGVTVISTTQASASQHADGLWYLVLSGDAATIARACSLGDCQQGFTSLYDAMQYWGSLLAQSVGSVFVPLPQPIQIASMQPKSAAYCRDGCQQKPIAALVCAVGKGCLRQAME